MAACWLDFCNLLALWGHMEQHLHCQGMAQHMHMACSCSTLTVGSCTGRRALPLYRDPIFWMDDRIISISCLKMFWYCGAAVSLSEQSGDLSCRQLAKSCTHVYWVGVRSQRPVLVMACCDLDKFHNMTRVPARQITSSAWNLKTATCCFALCEHLCYLFVFII